MTDPTPASPTAPSPMTASPTPMTAQEATAAAASVLDAVETAVVGKRESLELVLAGILAGGHVLLEDLPGLGKTLAARSFAQALGLPFTRAQFTPDLLPADLTGAEVFDQRTGEFVFRPGPVFTGLLLADEINRTPPKTQSALLEAMQERQVSVEGTTRKLPSPFHVLATANPIEHEGTYPLPEAQLDRFLLRLSFGYPTAQQEWDVVSRRLDRRREEQTVPEVLDAAGLLGVQQAVEDVHVDDSVGHYAVELVAATRGHQHALVGASPRGTLALITCARALAVIRGRSYVVPEDIKALAHPALDHRVTVKPELWLQNATGAGVVEAVLGQVAVPAAKEPTHQGSA
jgi:MoxR-like ATPase